MARPAKRRGKALSTHLLFKISIQKAGGRKPAVAARLSGKRGGSPQRGTRSHGRSSGTRSLPPFFLFMAQHRRELQDSHPRWSAVQLAKAMGKMWHRLPRSERAMYKEKAQRMKGRRGKGGRDMGRRGKGRREMGGRGRGAELSKK